MKHSTEYLLICSESGDDQVCLFICCKYPNQKYIRKHTKKYFSDIEVAGSQYLTG